MLGRCRDAGAPPRAIIEVASLIAACWLLKGSVIDCERILSGAADLALAEMVRMCASMRIDPSTVSRPARARRAACNQLIETVTRRAASYDPERAPAHVLYTKLARPRDELADAYNAVTLGALPP